ncbi:MAG: thioredoxin family protein [Ignavibacteriae bacterium]|nr:thioredoxin family protein [Ignavibacteria bacterium]MBI3363805.1 thioredoxin family protein [Ignavibacteriota bacterium]
MNTQPRKLGEMLPPFHNLRGVDGNFYAYTDFSTDILIIVFSCNHCPYVQAYEDRMIRLHREYEKEGVQLVAINSNDTKNYPDDSFELMVKRARDKGFNFPYLRDEDQSVADAFGATHTPQFFVFDKGRKLCYSGKMDDNWKEPGAVKETYLKDALDNLLAGEKVKVPETYSIGCTIKWKSL